MGDNNMKKPADDTVNLCSQTSYPGDDELQTLETEIMVKWKLDQAPDVEAKPVQDKQASRKNVDLFKTALNEGKHCDALVYIDLALETDFLNAALWVQRVSVLVALKDLREAFRSCAAILPLERPGVVWKMGGLGFAKCLTAHLDKMQRAWVSVPERNAGELPGDNVSFAGSILDKLGLPVTAESWLRNASRLAGPQDTSAAILFQKVRAKRLYQPLTQGMPVEVTFTDKGRAVCTTKPVKKGEVIFADKSILHAQTLPSLKFPCCANCVRSLIRPEDVFGAEEMSKSALQKSLKNYWPARERHPCQCGREMYCSETCKREAWDCYHRLICPEVNPAVSKLYQVCDSYKNLTSTDCTAFEGWWSASFSPVLLAKLWAQIVCTAVKLGNDNGRSSPAPMDWALARAPYRRFIAYGSGLKANVFPKMHELMTEIFRDLGDGLSYTITKEEFSGRYLQMACNTQSFSDADNPMGYLCRGIYSEPMLRPLLSYFQNKEHEGDFAGLFPVHACLNHSCANNAFVCDGKTPDKRPGCHVKAKRDLAAGEEVFNQYIDVNLTRKERRFALYRSYNFWCECDRCRFEGDGPDSCTECNVKAAEGKEFPKCSRCKQAWYCSTKCQKKAWKRGHKKICGLEL